MITSDDDDFIEPIKAESFSDEETSSDEGSKENPSHFRGETLSSCLSKLFNSIFNTCLTSFLEDRNALAKEQIGSSKTIEPQTTCSSSKP